VDKLTNTVHEFERAATDPVNNTYVLQLYIAGSTPRSQRAVVNIKKICKEFLKGKCELQVIDVFQQPLLAKAEQIFAVPTLIRKLPTPKRLFIGDMSDTKTILASLDS
jgi:circadian clock protein KaiB